MLLEILTGKGAVEVASNGQQANLARLVSSASKFKETKGKIEKKGENMETERLFWVTLKEI
jgi:hypothetical protein